MFFSSSPSGGVGCPWSSQERGTDRHRPRAFAFWNGLNQRMRTSPLTLEARTRAPAPVLKRKFMPGP